MVLECVGVIPDQGVIPTCQVLLKGEIPRAWPLSTGSDITSSMSSRVRQTRVSKTHSIAVNISKRRRLYWEVDRP